jgi:hypothetical protein
MKAPWETNMQSMAITVERAPATDDGACQEAMSEKPGSSLMTVAMAEPVVGDEEGHE